MKTLGLTIVLAVGVFAMLLAVVPAGITTEIDMYPERLETTAGLLRVGELRVENTGVFTRTISLPAFAACVGDEEIALDAYTEAGDTVVRGVGQVEQVTLGPGERGTIYLVARESGFGETVQVFERTASFSCLTAERPIR